MKTIAEILIIVLACFNLLLTWFVLFRLHQPTTLFLWIIKVLICALSPTLFLAGIVFAILGFVMDSPSVVLIGGLSSLIYLVYILRATRPAGSSTGFEKAFGNQLKNLEMKPLFLPSRYVLRLPKSPEPILKQNISFHTIPGSSRDLLCDIWQPPKNVAHSGLAFLYLHGSAWTSLDKDFGTRIFFRHLTSQGHVIMDVAYRLFPETDFMGMVHDVKHAIAWLKKNTSYGVNPDKIVIGGGSAGAHLALLVAYTDRNKQLTPPDLLYEDVSVCGVISLYGQSDLIATYYHTCQHLTSQSALGQKKTGQSGGMPSWIQKRMGKDFHRLGFDKDVEPGMLVPMLGGNPDEKPEVYSHFSPVNYIHNNCPPTLFLHGGHDILAPLVAIRKLYTMLTDTGVPTVLHVIPQTDHAFDLILPVISPSAHNAIYDVERFLSLLCYSYVPARENHIMEEVN